MLSELKACSRVECFLLSHYLFAVSTENGLLHLFVLCHCGRVDAEIPFNSTTSLIVVANVGNPLLQTHTINSRHNFRRDGANVGASKGGRYAEEPHANGKDKAQDVNPDVRSVCGSSHAQLSCAVAAGDALMI